MSTHDVPGAKAANKDQLGAGCWAEHDDGSLIFVKGTEQDQVVYEVYDLSQSPPVSYPDAMPAKEFKHAFSYAPVGKSKERWTWHDKTAFPWKRVMSALERPGLVARGPQTAASRVAEALKLKGHGLHEASLRHQTEEPAKRGRAVLEKIANALSFLKR